MTNVRKLRQLLAEWGGLEGSSGVLMNGNNQSFSSKVYSGQDPMTKSGSVILGGGQEYDLVVPPAVRKVVLDTEGLENTQLNDGFSEFLGTLFEELGLEKIVPGSNDEQVYVLVFEEGLSISIVIWSEGKKISVTYKVPTEGVEVPFDKKGDFPQERQYDLIMRTDTRELPDDCFSEEGDVDPNKFPGDWLKSIVNELKGKDTEEESTEEPEDEEEVYSPPEEGEMGRDEEDEEESPEDEEV